MWETNSKIKNDVNIFLETWKGLNSELNITGFKILQKFRKKNKRSRRYSGGIIVLYKNYLHKGIS